MANEKGRGVCGERVTGWARVMGEEEIRTDPA